MLDFKLKLVKRNDQKQDQYFKKADKLHVSEFSPACSDGMAVKCLASFVYANKLKAANKYNI